MGQRLELQALLTSLLGSEHVYFQPPPTIQMTYPCIVYRKDDEKTTHADNKPYSRDVRYEVTVIDRNPDSDIPFKVSDLPKCSFSRAFVANGLNHNVYYLFF